MTPSWSLIAKTSEFVVELESKSSLRDKKLFPLPLIAVSCLTFFFLFFLYWELSFSPLGESSKSNEGDKNRDSKSKSVFFPSFRYMGVVIRIVLRAFAWLSVDLSELTISTKMRLFGRAEEEKRDFFLLLIELLASRLFHLLCLQREVFYFVAWFCNKCHVTLEARYFIFYVWYILQ